MPTTPEWRTLYPFASHHFHLDSLAYHYVDEGAGKPLLMVHGNPTWSFYWRNLITAFRDDYRTVVPDHIGCGLSDKPQQYNYSLDQHIQNLSQLIDSLDLRDITLLAHDWGGAIGLGAALQSPERFARLVLFNTGAFPPPYVPWRLRTCRGIALGRVLVKGMNLFARGATKMAVAKRLAPEVKAGLLAPYDCWKNRVAVYRFVRDIPLAPSHPTWRQLAAIEDGLHRLADRPVQLIWGMKDWCFTEVCLNRLWKSFPDAEIHRFHGAGHYVIEDVHERIVPLVRDFLERNS